MTNDVRLSRQVFFELKLPLNCVSTRSRNEVTVVRRGWMLIPRERGVKLRALKRCPPPVCTPN